MKTESKQTSQTKVMPSTLKRVIIAGAILVVVFLLGYTPSCMSARSVEQENASLTYSLRVADLRGQLGMMSYEANRNNFASAAEYSTGFFDGLRDVVGQTADGNPRKELESILARRDEVTTSLAQADPSVKEKLAEMYSQFYRASAQLPR